MCVCTDNNNIILFSTDSVFPDLAFGIDLGFDGLPYVCTIVSYSGDVYTRESSMLICNCVYLWTTKLIKLLVIFTIDLSTIGIHLTKRASCYCRICTSTSTFTINFNKDDSAHEPGYEANECTYGTFAVGLLHGTIQAPPDVNIPAVLLCILQPSGHGTNRQTRGL